MDGIRLRKAELFFTSLYNFFTVLFNEVIEFLVASTYESKRVSVRVKKYLFQGLNDSDGDGGEELEAEPYVKGEGTRIGNVRVDGRVSSNEGLGEEVEDEVLEMWEVR